MTVFVATAAGLLGWGCSDGQHG